MKQFLKLVAIFFAIVLLLMPLLECFDDWDRPGLTNDTEFSVFLIAIFIMLALLAVVATTRRFFDTQCTLKVTALRCETPRRFSPSAKSTIVAPFLVLPLRT